VLLYRTAHDIEQAERLAADLATVLEQLITEAAEDE
jgi:pilus assembly protein TadC